MQGHMSQTRMLCWTILNKKTPSHTFKLGCHTVIYWSITLSRRLADFICISFKEIQLQAGNFLHQSIALQKCINGFAYAILCEFYKNVIYRNINNKPGNIWLQHCDRLAMMITLHDRGSQYNFEIINIVTVVFSPIVYVHCALSW